MMQLFATCSSQVVIWNLRYGSRAADDSGAANGSSGATPAIACDRNRAPATGRTGLSQAFYPDRRSRQKHARRKAWAPRLHLIGIGERHKSFSGLWQFGNLPHACAGSDGLRGNPDEIDDDRHRGFRGVP